jgi:hypothetical protein
MTNDDWLVGEKIDKTITIDGVEVEVHFGYEVGSKSDVKPKFSASIHRLITKPDTQLTPADIEERMKADLGIMMRLAQESLDYAPEIQKEKLCLYICMKAMAQQNVGGMN